MNKTLLVIVGPTAVGKTAFAIELAKKYSSEIISADSRQFYKEMKIGTARPDGAELENIPHHLLGHISIHQNYTVADFVKDANEKVLALFKERDFLIMCGGSGLYVDAFCNGLDDLPDSDPEIKNKLNHIFEQEGIAPLQKQLADLDPVYYQSIDNNNPHRLIRAIEVCLITGKKFSELRRGKKVVHPFRIIKIALNSDRKYLYERINLRVLSMMKQGLFEEVNNLYPHRKLKALKTVGYTEWFDFIDGKINKEQAVELIQQNSRRYAKRQLTWFRKDANLNWIDLADWEKAIAKAVQLIDEN